MMSDQIQIKLTGESRLWFEAGVDALERQDYQQATVEFERILRVEFDVWQVWYRQGLALQGLARYEDAIASYGAALRLSPPTHAAADIWYCQADALHYGLGEFKQAIAAYDQVLELQKHYLLAWLHRGNAQLYGLKLPYGAIASYNQALSLDPDYELLWYNRGNALAELGFYNAAVNNYDRALSLNPGDSSTQQARINAITRLNESLAAEGHQVENLENVDWERLSVVPTSPEETLHEGFRHSSTTIQQDTVIQVLRAEAENRQSARPDAPPRPPQPMILVQDSEGLRRIPLNQTHYSVGRDASCDIRLFSRFASRHHAVLVAHDAHESLSEASNQPIYQILDGDGKGRSSTNGIVVNGKKCRDRILQHGDTVVFGPKVWLRYLLIDEPAL